MPSGGAGYVRKGFVVATIVSICFSARTFAQGDNLRFGDFTLDLKGTMGQSYDSNIGRAPDNEQADWITRVGLGLSGDLELTEINRIRLRLGLEYRKYWRNPELDSHRNFLILSPDTEIAFLAQAGNFSFRIFDNLTFETDPEDRRFIDPDTGEIDVRVLAFNRFRNLAGVEGAWQINPFWNATMGVSRLDVVPLDSEFRDLQRNTHTVSAGLNHHLAANMDVGIWTKYSETRWRTDFQPDSDAVAFGGVVRWQPTQMIETETLVGWTRRRFDAVAGNQDETRTADGITGNFTVRHFVNPVVEHALTYRRDIILGAVSNAIEVQSVDYDVKYSGYDRSSVDFGVGWYEGVETGRQQPERFDRWIFRAGFGYDLSSQLDFRLSFEHSFRNSSIEDRDFSRNLATVMLSYDF